MKKPVKIILWSLLGLVVLAAAGFGFIVYQALYGFPVYETQKPVVQFPRDRPAILIFSKTTAFRHGASIEASLPVFTHIARRNGWFIYQTEEGGIFNPEQLSHFKAVVFNNSTGPVLTDEQQALSHYVETGGALVGIHGAGDSSHKWPWYETNLLGTRMSHHPINPHLQTALVHVEPTTDSTLRRRLPAAWPHEDEWYVFFSQPKNVTVLGYINGDKIIPNGNLLWVRDKNFGMGNYHPVAWYRQVGQGKSFYTSMGHEAGVWQKKEFVQLVENALHWSVSGDNLQQPLANQEK